MLCTLSGRVLIVCGAFCTAPLSTYPILLDHEPLRPNSFPPPLASCTEDGQSVHCLPSLSTYLFNSCSVETAGQEASQQ
ncbi:hypothetical protein IWX50DRAFT_644220 [Phyllosticta citricarpa]